MTQATTIPPIYLVEGLTLRGHFAAMALQKLIGPDEISMPNGRPAAISPADRVHIALQYADALLAALSASP